MSWGILTGRKYGTGDDSKLLLAKVPNSRFLRSIQNGEPKASLNDMQTENAPIENEEFSLQSR